MVALDLAEVIGTAGAEGRLEVGWEGGKRRGSRARVRGEECVDAAHFFFFFFFSFASPVCFLDRFFFPHPCLRRVWG